MKKSLLTFGLIVFTSYSAFSQISINVEGQTTDISGQTINFNNTTGDEEIIDLIIHNNTGGNLDWKITRSRIDVPASGWTDYLCWGAEGDATGGTCYPASLMPGATWVTPQDLPVANSNAGVLAIHINPDDLVSGTGHYRYYVGQDGDLRMDSVDLIISTSTLSLKETKQVTVSVNPNPADNFLSINVPAGSEGFVKLTDVLGKTIYDERLSISKKLDVSSFKNGVYVALINVNGTSYTKRFVVKH